VTVGEWLDARTPPAPSALADRLRSAVADGLARDAADAPGVLLAAAEDRLARSLAGAPDGCGDGFELLTIDALVTYAFEAAADRPLEHLDAHARDALARITALGDRCGRAREDAGKP
jgi:hypothetical protein